MVSPTAHGSWSAPLDPLIGRAKEMALIAERLEQGRLITLVGPGGAGKTRLAQAAVDVHRAEGQAAWFVDASALQEPGLLAPTIIATLRLDVGATEDPVAAIARTIGAGNVLIVLDNVEQIAGVGKVVSSLLESTSNLRLLATSRLPLRVRGEMELPVPMLALPPDGSPASIAASAAGALFLARAREAGRLDGLDADAARDVAALVHHLDGLPLAIELAAARTRIMRPGEILRRLLAQGAGAIDTGRDGPHRSLVAIVDWSLGLLTEPESEAMTSLAVCAGFDYDLAAAMLPDQDVGGTIEKLVTLGLVAPVGEVDGTTRFKVPETVRVEVLRRAPEPLVSAVRARHARVLLDLAGACWRRVDEVGDMAALDRLEVDADNARLALDELERTDRRLAFALWYRLHPFWESRTRLHEGLQRFERMTEPEPSPSPEYAAALTRFALDVPWVRGDRVAKEAMERALAVARTIDDLPTIVDGLAGMAVFALNAGDLTMADDVARELDEIAPRCGPEQVVRIAETRHHIAAARHGSASDEAVAALQVAAQRATRPRQRMGLLGNLALDLLYRGEYPASVAAAEEAVLLTRKLRHQLLSWALGTLAMGLAGTGDVDRAVAVLDEAIELSLALDSPVHSGGRLLSAMPVAAAAGRPLIAASAWGAAQALESAGVDIPPDDRLLADRTMKLVAAQAPQIDIALALDDGGRADPRELLRTIPGLLRSPDQGGRIPVARVRHRDLTRREVEIMALVGQGKTDAEIGELLFISPKTASVHVTNIKGKLDLGSRLELAMRARELRLPGGADPVD